MTGDVGQLMFGRPAVLVVEDDAEALDELMEMIDLEGRAAYAANSIDQAITILDETPLIGIIVTDVHLVGPNGVTGNGLDLVERSYARFPERPLSFIVLSGDATVAGTSIQTGAVDFLNKPLCADAFAQKLDEAEKSIGKTRNASETTRFLLEKVAATVEGDPDAPGPAELYDVDPSFKKLARVALREGRIQPWFQPRISLAGDRLCGFETLARLVETDGSVLVPAAFLPLARASGVLGEIDEQLRSTALHRFGMLAGAGAMRPHICLKLTIHDLAKPSVVGKMLLELDGMEVAPSSVSIELLDVQDLPEELAGAVRANLERISSAGVHIELNDAGASHAILSKGGRLVLNRVKLGRSSIHGVDEDPALQKTARNLIAFAKALGAEVLACGVETQGELDWLREEGCDIAQGFLIAPPMQLADVLTWAGGYAGNATQQKVAS